MRLPITGRMLWAGLLLAVWPSPAPAEETVAQQVRAMTGAPTRIVWNRNTDDHGHAFGPWGNQPAETWNLIVLDTEEGKERVLTAKPGAYHSPIMTPNGKRVVFTDLRNRQGLIIDWNGAKERKLCDTPRVLGVAEDPAGTEWVYYAEGAFENANTPAVYRLSIDQPGAAKELVWNKTPSNDKWEVSRDGKFAASGFPWPKQGVAALPNGELWLSGEGCQGALAPDGSRRNFHMRGDHTGIVVSDQGGANERYVSLAAGLPAPGGMSAWAPRWSMYDVRFFTHGGPYPGGDGMAGDVFLCRFNDGLTKVAKRLRLSADPHTDTHACAWIQPGGTPEDIAVKPLTLPPGGGPGMLLREVYEDIPGNDVADLTNADAYPDHPTANGWLTSFEAQSNVGDSYGARVRGFVIAPITGDYIFWIASDDQGELWLSTDEQPAHRKRICRSPSWAPPRAWDKSPEQKSAPVKLEAGKRYAIEALHKEGGGNDNLAVGWQLPDGTQERPIPGNRLAPPEK